MIKNIRLLLINATCFWFLSGFSLHNSSLLSIDRLYVEYLEEPNGLDVPKPRFSWVLNAKKDNIFAKRQTAYRVIVASSLKNIQLKKGDVWDTGWVESDNMSQIPFEGEPLLSDRTYYWAVAIKDEEHRTSEWSTIKKWSTGLLNDPWRGLWIGGDEVFDPTAGDNNIWDPWLRKPFNLSIVPKKATIFVASLGYHELYINGKRVGDEVLAPVVTDHTKRARYVAYDIAKYLKKGKNVIGIWLGTSWSIFPGYDVDGSRPLTPLVTAQVDMYQEENPTSHAQPIASLITDGSWKYKPSPRKLIGLWDFGKMGGELWDDRKAEDNWADVIIEDSEWSKAQVYSLPLLLSSQNMPGNRLFEKIEPIAIEENTDGSFKIDMGVNFAGWTEVRLKGNEGDQIDFFYSEREHEEMTFNLRSSFIIGKSGEGTFKNKFNYSSGRWITIRGLKYKPSLRDIKGWLVRSDYKEAAHFESDDSLHNWMYNTIKWTYENLSLGGFIVDCPQRERMGYGGDAHATSETGMYNYQLGAFYSKWMQDWRDVQGTEPMVGNMRDKTHARKKVTSGRIFNNGILPHTAPTYWGGGGPSWGGIVVTLPWFMYQQYGDTKVLHENFQMIKDWLSFLDTHVEDDLLKRFGGRWDFLGDWLWPNATAEGMNNDKPETLVLNNAYRVFNLRTAAKIAEVIGDTAQADVWISQAELSSNAIHEKFYNTHKGIYADGSMAILATALLADIVPIEEKEKVMESLETEIMVNRKGHIHAGITGGALLFKLLREKGRNDLLYAMTSKKSYPSWGYMKENGATTIWEMWEKDLPGHSLLHSSFLYPGAWYIEGMAGIKPYSPGYKKFIVEPPIEGDTNLKRVKASFDSPVGKIKVFWQRQDGRLQLAIEVPPNSICLLKLPLKDTENISEKTGVIKQVEKDEHKIVYELQSGVYAF